VKLNCPFLPLLFNVDLKSNVTPMTEQKWCFDMNTGLPSPVNFQFPNPTNASLHGNATILFTSWQKNTDHPATANAPDPEQWNRGEHHQPRRP
jgi:hypothetical protein